MRTQIRVDGLAQLRRSLRNVGDLEDVRELQTGLKAAAEVVASEARGRMPVESGRARDAVRAVSAGNRQLVVGGKKAVPYYGWLDFGSRTPRTGNARSVGPWTGSGRGPRKGRFIYPALDATKRQVIGLISSAVDRALRRLDL